LPDVTIVLQYGLALPKTVPVFRFSAHEREKGKELQSKPLLGLHPLASEATKAGMEKPETWDIYRWSSYASHLTLSRRRPPQRPAHEGCGCSI